MDVESFDYAYFPRSAKGFKIALNDATDKAVINQDGFYIRPGIFFIQKAICEVFRT
jgi:hypothetical protein